MERTKAPPAPTRKPDHTFRNAGGVKIQAWDYTEEDRNPSDVDVKKVDPEQVPDATEDADATQQSERFIYVHSEARQKTEEQILEKKGVEYEQAIMKIHQGLSTPRCLKDYDKVLIKIGRLKQKFTSGSHLYEVSVTGSDTDPKRAQSVTITQLPAHRRRALAVGGYILRTSHTDWTLEEVVRLYWRRTEIESAFRSMKSDLGMRPIYHSKDAHIEAHLLVTALTYYMVQIARFKLKKQGIHQSWNTIRTHLNRIRRVTTRLPKSNHCDLIHVCDQDLTPFVLDLVACLNLTDDPKATKTVREYTQEPSLDRPKKPPDP